MKRWEIGDPVWVNSYNIETQERQWERGIVKNVEGFVGLEANYKVVVYIQADDDPDDPSEWSALPRSVNKDNFDPIPTKLAPERWAKTKK